MLVLGFPFALVLVSAQHQVAGIGRLSSDSTENVQFNLDVYASAVNGIISSVNNGPNRTTLQCFPVEKLYGVNIGNWLVSEAWMSPDAWIAMGGQICARCHTCRQSEWSLATYLGREETNAVFKQHWESWLTQDDVDDMVAAGFNSIRVPLGFWIIEDIVDVTREPYAQGGLDELIRGLNMFKHAGLYVNLDHHALPGVSALNQMFAGNCTSQVEFYNSTDDYNYKRAVTWSIVMAYLSHTHPAFETVYTIEAVNEPLQDANLTPGLGRFEEAFVLGIRAIELTLGIICDDTLASGFSTDSIAKLSEKYGIGSHHNFDAGELLGSSGEISVGHLGDLPGGGRQKHCLATQFMNRDWQWNNPSNPTDFAHGPQIYDNHLYFNYGGVAPNATEESYMQTLCNITRIGDAIAIGNAPLITGEWSLATAFNTTFDFLRKWGDAQKLTYVEGSGWTFWNWKIIMSDSQPYPQYLQWSYKDALEAGLFTAKPYEVFDKHVCAPYLNITSLS